MKRSLIMTAALAILLALCVGAALADQSGTCGDNVNWSLDSATGVLTISGTGPMTDFSYNTSPFKNNSDIITAVIIGDGVTSIGSYVFEDCTSLTSVTIPKSVKVIGSSAFSNCTSLTGITIPENVTDIGGAAFYNCASLTDITIPAGVTVIESHTFFKCTSLTSVINPASSIISVGMYAFNGCSSLRTISFPNVTTLDADAFGSCFSLKTVYLPCVITLKDCAFRYCSSLETAYIPNACAGHLFDTCTNLREATIGGNIVQGCFLNCTNLTTVTLTKGTIGENAFDDCENLTCVTLGNGVTGIGDRAFYNCRDHLKILTIPASVESIHDYAFFGSGINSSGASIFYAGTQDLWGEIFKGTVSASVYCFNPDIVYSVGFTEIEHGQVSADKKSDKVGEPVTLTVTPDPGYALDTLTYSYTMADGPQTRITVDIDQTARVFYIPVTFGYTKVYVTATFLRTDIGSEADWNELANKVSAGSRTEDKYFRLTNDISVSAMIGTNDHPFKGTFDGGGHTLTFNKSTNERRAAPFRYIRDAEIKNLRVAGTIAINEMFAGGIAGFAYGTCTITNCRSSVTIDSSYSDEGTHGGFIALMQDDCKTTFTGCVFDGEMLGETTKKCGGFVGYARPNGKTTFRDCLFAPAVFEPTESQNFARYDDTVVRTLNNCWYHEITLGENQGAHARTVTAEPAVPLDFIEGKMYDVSGIRSNTPGLSCGGILYTPGNTAVNLTIASLPEGITFENPTASAGTLTGSGSGWTLVMPNEDVVLTTSLSGAFGKADFRLPANVTAIGANAFRGARMTAVEIPDGCASIGAGAFRDCAELGKIRIPESVTEIDPTAFDGCPLVLVFSREPSKAKEYCEDAAHRNCVFMKEK